MAIKIVPGVKLTLKNELIHWPQKYVFVCLFVKINSHDCTIAICHAHICDNGTQNQIRTYFLMTLIDDLVDPNDLTLPIIRAIISIQI